MKLLLLLGLLGASGPNAGTILQKVDSAANRAQDAVITLTVQVSRSGSDPLNRTLKIWQQGAERRMIKFLGPARLRGTGILVPRQGQTHLYLPAYKRVRRVAGKEGSGSFMGMGFSINDLARVRFVGDYLPSLESETATHYVLSLKPTVPEDHRHARLRIRVRKKDFLVDRITTLNGNGKALRTIATDDFRKVGKYMLAHRIQIDEIKSGKRTLALVTKAEFDTGLSASDFTERQLKRAP